MNLADIEESYLLSLTHDHQNLYIEFNVLLESRKIIKIFANNKSTEPIAVEFVGLNLRPAFTTHDGVPCIGEIESLQLTDTGFCLEGDMGIINVKADAWSISNAL